LLPGLWDLPGAFAGDDAARARGAAQVADGLPFPLATPQPVGSVRHAVTYRRIVLHVHQAEVREEVGASAAAPVDAGGAELAWVTPAQADGRALSSPARRILRRFAGLLDTSA
jgi:hypothetical protein